MTLAFTLGIAAAVASGWIAAFVVALRWRSQTADMGALRLDHMELDARLEVLTNDYETSETERKRLQATTERLRASLDECEAGRIATAPADDLADLSSRGVRDDEDGGETRTSTGPVPHRIIDPGDPDVSGGGSE